MEAIFFDYFGVICGSTYWSDVYRQEEDKGNQKRMDGLAEEVNSGRISWQAFCEQVARNIGSDPQEVEKKYHEQRIDAAVVTCIKSLGHTHKVYLASNAHHEFLEPILDELGLRELFDDIFISSRLGVTKPHADFYQQLLKKTGHSAEACVFIDDLVENVEAAEEAGMAGVYFTDADDLKKLMKILTNV